MKSVKGKLFEYFVCKLLLCCGFKPVKKDQLIIFDGGPGTMIQGLGQVHNADVLLEPPFQTPFYFSTRLLIECKCYSDKVGLPIVRNALGLREDINRMDIVTEEILENRKLAYTTKTTCHPMKRYNYQVAVASFSGFKTTTIPFSQTHRIPLISFAESHLFDRMRETILEVEESAKQDELFADEVLRYLKKHQDDLYEENVDYRFGVEFDNFIDVIKNFQEKIVIGLLVDGTILFMIKEENLSVRSREEKRYNDGFSIHWSKQNAAWELYDGEQRYWFELPKEIYQEWIDSEVERSESALDIKQRYFTRIIMFDKNYMEQGGSIRTINLSRDFMNSAKRKKHVL